MYVFGGSLADLASIGAAATADVSQLKKKKWLTFISNQYILAYTTKHYGEYYEVWCEYTTGP
jgi:hypothetical protein